ncbi:MAG: hypothetical protein RIT04_479 [Candidatus Parcubacteria bacterium]|jgi:uncharacterized membrane protein
MPHFIETAYAADATADAITGAILGPIISYVINPLYLLIVLLATVVFVWGVAGLILHGEEPDKRADAQRHILWGVIGLFMMLAVYGIIRFVANSLGVDVPLFH